MLLSSYLIIFYYGHYGFYEIQQYGPVIPIGNTFQEAVATAPQSGEQKRIVLRKIAEKLSILDSPNIPDADYSNVAIATASRKRYYDI